MARAPVQGGQTGPKRDGALQAVVDSVARFTAILPELAPDAGSATALSRHAARLNRSLRFLFGQAAGTDALEPHLPLIARAAERIDTLVRDLEVEAMLGTASIPPIDDLALFTKLRHKPLDEVRGLLETLLAPADGRGGAERVGLHYALLELGVPAALGLGPVGWIKLILVCLLVLLLIIGLFKPELIPAVTALAQVLAAIDALGGAGPEAKGAAGPPLPPLPPGYVMIKRPDGTIIYGPPGTSWKPDGTMTVPGAPEQPKTETIEHATWEFCHRYVFKIPAGRELVIQVVTGTPDMYLIVTEIGKDPESISPPDSRRYLGPTTVEFHPVGKRGGSVDVVIGIQ